MIPKRRITKIEIDWDYALSPIRYYETRPRASSNGYEYVVLYAQEERWYCSCEKHCRGLQCEHLALLGLNSTRGEIDSNNELRVRVRALRLAEQIEKGNHEPFILEDNRQT